VRSRRAWGFLLPALLIHTVLFSILYFKAADLGGETAASLRTWVVMLWIVGGVALFIAKRRHDQVSEDARAKVEEMLARIENGETQARVPLEQAGELRVIAAALNRTAGAVEERWLSVVGERDDLKRILSAMDDGVIVVDATRRVQLANAAARRMLSCGDAVQGRALQDLCRTPELLENTDASISNGATVSVEFQLATDVAGERLSLMARCAPFERGAVIVLHDISELRRLERMRSEFVANVSHELRTPLTSLLGYLETLQDEPWDDQEEAKRFIVVCRRQAERLSRIVEDLLRLSRLESPQQMANAVEVDLGDVVSTAVEGLRSMADERGIGLAVDVGGRRALVPGDRGLLTQAISNLIENAINYNREKGRVTVKMSGSSGTGAEGAGYQWDVTVSDTGIGIPKDALSRIFERFYRVDKARSRERGGTGLGLAIVKHIALAHGATIQVESELEKGTTFTLKFRSREAVV
jgi:two-component system, OmpR family, phosphate regulon sensor histidine kinase PhoR